MPHRIIAPSPPDQRNLPMLHVRLLALTLFWVVFMTGLAVRPAAGAALPDAATVEQLMPQRHGLIVVLGTTDGELERDLARAYEGGVLIHGIASTRQASDAARITLRDAGQYGIASVQAGGVVEGKLPYATHVVNAVVASGATLQAMGVQRDGVERVLRPGGVLITDTSGRWQASEVKRPEAMDIWTHFKHDHTNNGVSRDELVGPITTVRWIQDYAFAGYHMINAALPVTDGDVVVTGHKFYGRVSGRDAFNGLPRWQRRLGWIKKDASPVYWGFIAGPYYLTEAQPHLSKDGPPTLIRLSDGSVAGQLRAAGPVRGEGVKIHHNSSQEHTSVALDGKLYISIGNRLRCIDLDSHELLWDYTGKTDAIIYPTLDKRGERLFCVETNTQRLAFGRWPGGRVAALTCLDAATGDVEWRNDKDYDGRFTSYPSYRDGKLLLHSTTGIISIEGHDKEPVANITLVDASSGKPIWETRGYHGQDAGRRAGTARILQSGLLLDDHAFVGNAGGGVFYDLKDGSPIRELGLDVTNQRCERVTATQKTLLGGFGWQVDLAEGTYVDQNVARSGCATGAVPANGMVYKTPNGCGCFAQLRGFGGFASDTTPSPLPANGRVERDLAPGPGGYEPTPLEQPELTTYSRGVNHWKNAVSVRKPILDEDVPILRREWHNNEYVPVKIESAKVGDLTLNVFPNEHRVEAVRDGKIAWTLTADARILHTPLVHAGRVYVGSADGWVYCVQPESGKVAWRALAAPAHRRMVAYGQLESAWPVMNLLVHRDMIWAPAGRHPELDGGIRIVALDPTSGKTVYETTLAEDTAHRNLPVGEQLDHEHQNPIVNGGLAFIEGELYLTNPLWALNTGRDQSPQKRWSVKIPMPDSN